MGKVLTEKAKSWRTTITRLLIFTSTLLVLVFTFSFNLPDNINNDSRLIIVACLVLCFLSISFGFYALNKLTDLEGHNVYIGEVFPNEKGPYGQELKDATDKAGRVFDKFQVIRQIQIWTFIVAMFLIVMSSILFVMSDFFKG